jgi:hypothetical protein
MKTLIKAAVIAMSLSAAAANATVLTFNGYPATTFDDGTLSTGLSGYYNDGFYAVGTTTAYNGYGQTGESISFNSAKQLNELTLSPYFGLNGVNVVLYNNSGNLITQQTANFLTTPGSQTLTFNANDVAKVVFDNIGGANYYGDGRVAGWYYLSNVTYSDNVAVPEPATLAVFGLGMMGLAAARRRSAKK